MAETRTANSTWEGDLTSGGGLVSAATSGAFSDMAVTQPTRFGGSEGNTSPEELIAAAHASCYSMALSAGLTRAGTPPGKLEVSASVTLDFVDGAPTVVSSALTVEGTVDGISEEEFVAAAEAAKDGCPISRALAGVEVSLASASLA
jgi:osmotically inducible protein OsmC